MEVITTEYFRKHLLSKGRDPDQFVETFFNWKKQGSAGEYTHPMFGKDAGFRGVTIHGVHSFKHTHLRPKNKAARKKWYHDLENKSIKTSDTFLLYVQNKDKFLLIAILDEPGAHDAVNNPVILKMFIDVAEEFINYGSTDF